MKCMRARNLFYFLFAISSFLFAGCASAPVTTPPPKPTRDGIFEKKLEQQLLQINPTAVPVYQDATKALDATNYEASKKLYGQVIVLAPAFSAAYRRLGYIEDTLRNTARAEELTRKALEIEPNGYNQIALANILLEKDTSKDLQDAFNLASAAVKLLPDDESANSTWLMSAGAIEDMETVRKADARLLDVAPNNYLAHYFAGLIANTDGNWEEAEAELLDSERLGMPAKIIENTLKSGISRNALATRFFRWSGVGFILWLLSLISLYLIGEALSKATIKALNQPQSAIGTPIQPAERRIRGIYRVLINILSLYFYFSVPFVILALLSLFGGSFFIFLVFGSFPIQFSIFLVITLIMSLFSLVQALLLRRDKAPLERELYKKNAPALWQLVENVAQKLNTRPIDTIYLTSGTEMAVYEKGGILQKLRGAGKRHLILGMGVLSVLNQGQFASILAHEYGHFSHQDTAGGDMAYFVSISIQQLMQRLVQARLAFIFNPVWLFVITYQRIFLRVTLGASRLQEVLADRYAAIAYGSQYFVEGLRIVIRQSVVFPIQMNDEFDKSFKLKQPVHNLYSLEIDESLQSEINQKIDEVMNCATSQYDSHPAPKDRITWIEQLNILYQSTEESTRPALDLLPNPKNLQRELTNRTVKRFNVRNA